VRLEDLSVFDEQAATEHPGSLATVPPTPEEAAARA
jgi:hypothetical protein